MIDGVGCRVRVIVKGFAVVRGVVVEVMGGRRRGEIVWKWGSGEETSRERGNEWSDECVVDDGPLRI